MNLKDINWITDVIEAKIAPYKPNNLLMSNSEIDHAAAETSFEAIFSIKPRQFFVWFN